MTQMRRRDEVMCRSPDGLRPDERRRLLMKERGSMNKKNRMHGTKRNMQIHY
jgi:hypothetical protein